MAIKEEEDLDEKNIKIENLSLQYQHYFGQNRTAVYEANTPNYNLLHIAMQLRVKQNLTLIDLGIVEEKKTIKECMRYYWK